MKLVLILLMVCALQVSCSSNVTPSSEPAATPVAPQNVPTPIPTRAHIFEIDAWVDDPNPQLGSRVMLYGSLIKDGVHLGGMAMRATWPDENQARGVPNCSVQVIYGSGVCIVETEGFQPDVYVPITVTFDGARYPTEADLQEVYAKLTDQLHLVSGTAIARDLGNARAANVVLLGAVSTFLDVPAETWLEVIEARVPPKYVEVNRQAFMRGRQATGG